MSSWKSVEKDTIHLYEQIHLFQPNAVIPNPESDVEDDFWCSTHDMTRYESKFCFSAYHHREMFEMGYDANCIAYMRLDQLQRYYDEDLKNPHLNRIIILDCRIIDLNHFSILGVNNFVRKRVDQFYEVKKRWSITLTTARELKEKEHLTLTSRVSARRRMAYCNNPNWDGYLVNIPTTEFKTMDLTPAINDIGAAELLKAR